MRSKELIELNRSTLERQERLRYLVDSNEDVSNFVVDFLNTVGYFSIDSTLDANKLAFNSGMRYAALTLLSGLGYGGAASLKFNKNIGENNGR